MQCLINLLAMCIFDPSNIYITAEAWTPINSNTDKGQGRWCENRWCPGPVGELRIGMTVDVSRNIEVRYGLKHESMLTVMNDRGQESVFVQMTWRPFR